MEGTVNASDRRPENAIAARHLQKISEAKIYRDYQIAFSQATRLPLDIHAPQMPRAVQFSREHQSPFCNLMAKSSRTCAACLKIQRTLERKAVVAPITLRCFAGLCHGIVPVRVHCNAIAFLHTGQVFLEKPSAREFSRVANILIQLGAESGLKEFERAYFCTRVLPAKQFEGFVRLLAIFARHLAECIDQFQADCSEPDHVSRVRAFIVAHHTEQLSLTRVANTINLSANYFSEFFKKHTGMTFTNYVTQVRIEKAKRLLQHSRLQITDVAFHVGFESLSQFNRSFKRIVNQSPRAYREQVRSAC